MYTDRQGTRVNFCHQTIVGSITVSIFFLLQKVSAGKYKTENKLNNTQDPLLNLTSFMKNNCLFKQCKKLRSVTYIKYFV